jgi:hypothetical protein
MRSDRYSSRGREPQRFPHDYKPRNTGHRSYSHERDYNRGRDTRRAPRIPPMGTRREVLERQPYRRNDYSPSRRSYRHRSRSRSRRRSSSSEHRGARSRHLRVPSGSPPPPGLTAFQGV